MEEFRGSLSRESSDDPHRSIARSSSFESGLDGLFDDVVTQGDIHKDGYFLAKAVFDSEFIATLRHESFGALDLAKKETAERLAFEPDGTTPRVLFDIDKLAPSFDRLIKGARVQDVADRLLGVEHYTYQTRVNWKFKDTGEVFAWHSDFETWTCLDGVQRMQLFTFCVFLSDNTTETGCLEVIPGSHNELISSERWDRPNRANTDDYSFREGSLSKDLIAQKFANYPVVQLQGSPGDVLLLDCNVLHRSGYNSDRPDRANFYVVFNRSDNTPDLSKLNIPPRASHHCRAPAHEL